MGGGVCAEGAGYLRSRDDSRDDAAQHPFTFRVEFADALALDERVRLRLSAALTVAHAEDLPSQALVPLPCPTMLLHVEKSAT